MKRHLQTDELDERQPEYAQALIRAGIRGKYSRRYMESACDDLNRKVFQIAYFSRLWKEGNQYIAEALPLHVMSWGKTRKEAEAAVKEAVDVFIKTAGEKGTLMDVLASAGYDVKTGKGRK